jgi:hypothetical protein
VSTTTHTAAGTYSSDTWSFAGTANYNNIAATTITDTINKATPTITVSFGTSPIPYDGNSHPATTTTAGVGGADLTTGHGSLTVTYTPGPGAPLNAGSYSASAHFTSSDGNYNDASSATDATLTIEKANSVTVVSVAGGVSFTYDGDSHPATVSVTGAGGLNLTPAPVYSGGHAPIDVADSGSTASYNFPGDANHNASTDSKTYTISKADPIVTATGGTFTYDGNAHAGSGSATGVKGEGLTPVNVAYKDALNTLLTSAPVNAGSYQVAARFAGNGNYNQKQSAPDPLTINKADSVTVVSVAGGVSFTYDGDSHPATVTVIGAGGLNLTPAPVYSAGHAPIDVADSGSTASYNFPGDPNHNPSSDSKTYTISKADPIVTATGGTFTYDGAAHAGSGSAKGVKGESLTPVNVAYKDALNTLLTSAPVNAGSYQVAARFAGNGNYNQKQSAAVSLTIN